MRRYYRALAPTLDDISSIWDYVTDDSGDKKFTTVAPAPGKRGRGGVALVHAASGKQENSYCTRFFVATPVDGGAGASTGTPSAVGMSRCVLAVASATGNTQCLSLLVQRTHSPQNLSGPIPLCCCPMRRTCPPAVPATDDTSSAGAGFDTSESEDDGRAPAAPATCKRGRGGVARERKRKPGPAPAPLSPPVGGGAGAGTANPSDFGVIAHVTVDPVVAALSLPQTDTGSDEESVFAVAGTGSPAAAAVGGPGHVCGECGISFPTPSKLIRHVRVHTGERPFPCGDCDKSFSRKDHLSVHQRTHKGERLYACTQCEQAFLDSSSLSRHIRAVHTTDRPFKCGGCSSTFATAWDLTVHNRTHTGDKPFACPSCDKSFSTSGNLSRHLLTHTGERPYPCSVCDKAFSNPSALIVHIRGVHTGEKPFV